MTMASHTQKERRSTGIAFLTTSSFSQDQFSTAGAVRPEIHNHKTSGIFKHRFGVLS